jgi:hypothetical protein
VSAPTGNGSNNRKGSAIGSSIVVLVSLSLFIVAFIAFMLAPLLMVAGVAGGMWALERWGKKKRKRRGVVVAPAVQVSNRLVGSTVDTDEPATSYGFGARVGENL